jgi:APA family basic amino acid/polyamine antiporter
MLMFSLPADNWLRLFAWLAIGFVIYFAYGRKHSVMNNYTAEDRARHEGARPSPGPKRR